MTRVLVVADVRLYRDGLVEMLRRDGRVSVVGAAAAGDELLRQIRDRGPHAVLLDITMSGSLDLVAAINAAAPDVNIIALGIPEVESDVIRYAEAGVSGYVPREASVAQLVKTVTGVARGEFACSPRIAAALLRRVATLAAAYAPEAPVRDLTSREREITQLIETGLSNKEIARRLSIEVATVKNHVHSILKKLRVHRRGEAAALVRRTPRARPQPPALV